MLKNSRRWCSFSLRTLLVLIAVLAMLFAWAGSVKQAYEREQAALSRLRPSFHVQVEYLCFKFTDDLDLQFWSGPGDPPSQVYVRSRGPLWLRKWLSCSGHPILDRAETVILYEPAGFDEDTLATLGELLSVRSAEIHVKDPTAPVVARLRAAWPDAEFVVHRR